MDRLNSSPEKRRRGRALQEIAERYGVDVVYAFGSRAEEAAAFVFEEGPSLSQGGSDLDIGVLPAHGRVLSVAEKADLAADLEDFFGTGRVDLVLLTEADPFLAANIVRGARLYAADHYRADEYELYVLRRAGDLAPLERERLRLVFGEGECPPGPFQNGWLQTGSSG